MKKTILTTVLAFLAITLSLSAINTTAHMKTTQIEIQDKAPCGGKCGKGKCASGKCGAGKCNAGK